MSREEGWREYAAKRARTMTLGRKLLAEEAYTAGYRQARIDQVLDSFAEAIRDVPMNERQAAADWLLNLKCRDEPGGETEADGTCVRCGARAGEPCKEGV